MLPRIRTLKPEFFLHEGLFDLETEVKLPIRLSFAGLLPCCDREGRFRWRPRELKARILPYDEGVDFGRVLDALLTRGFVLKYASGTEEFGWIPTFRKHQHINNRESASILPAHPEDTANHLDNASRTRQARDEHGGATGTGTGTGTERESTRVARVPHTSPRANGFEVQHGRKASKSQRITEANQRDAAEITARSYR